MSRISQISCVMLEVKNTKLLSTCEHLLIRYVPKRCLNIIYGVRLSQKSKRLMRPKEGFCACRNLHDQKWQVKTLHLLVHFCKVQKARIKNAHVKNKELAQSSKSGSRMKHHSWIDPWYGGLGSDIYQWSTACSSFGAFVDYKKPTETACIVSYGYLHHAKGVWLIFKVELLVPTCMKKAIQPYITCQTLLKWKEELL